MNKALAAALMFCVFYALQITLQSKLVRGVIHPVQLIFLINTAAVMMLSLWFALRNRTMFRISAPRATLFRFGLATLLWMLTDITSVIGLSMSSSLNLSILSRLQLFITYIGAIMFLGEVPATHKLAALVLATVGSVLTVYRGQALSFNPGDILFLVFALAISISGLLRQHVGGKLPAVQMTYYMLVTSAVVTGTYVLLFDPLSGIPSPAAILAIAFLMVTGFTGVNYAIAKGGATQFALVSNLLPVTTAILAYFVVGEVPQVSQIVGGGIVIAGIVMFIGSSALRAFTRRVLPVRM